MSIRQIMSSPVVTVEADDKLSDLNEIFLNTNFHHVLVVDKKKLFGVVSDRDLFKALSPRIGTMAERDEDTAILNKRVHQIMTRKPVVLMPDDSIYRVIEVFENNKISCIPIVDENRVPVGIVSWRDMLKVIRRTS